MRRIFLFTLLLISVLYRVHGQETQGLKQKFLSTPASGWNNLFTENKGNVNAVLVNGWREDAIALYNESNFDDATQLIEICIQLSDQLHDVSLKGKSLLVKAEILYFKKDYATAIKIADLAGGALKQAGETLQFARSKHRIGLCYYELEDYQKAIKAFDESIVIKKQLIAAEPENKSLAESLYGSYDKYGDALYSASNFDKEIEINKEALTLTKKWGFTADEAYTNYCLGWTYYRAKKQGRESIPYFEASIQYYTVAKDTAFLLYNYRELIKARESIEDFSGVQADAAKIFPVLVSMSNKTKALEFTDFFIKRFKENSTDEATPFYETRERLFLASPDSLIKYKSESAEYYSNHKEFDRSMGKYREVLNFKLTAAMKGDLYWSMGIVEDRRKGYQKEVEYFREALKYYSTTPKKYNQIVLLSNIGITYRNQEDSTQSFKAHDEAVIVALDNPDSINLKHSFEKAIETYDHFKKPNLKATLLAKSYQHYYQKKEFDKSGELAKMTAKQYEESLQDFDRADKYYRLSVESYEKTADVNNLGDSWWSLGYNLGENKKDNRGSIEAYRKASDYYFSLKDTAKVKTLESNIGINYRLLNDSINSYKAHNKAIAITLKNSDPENLFYAYTKAIGSYDYFNDSKKERATLLKKYELALRMKDNLKSGETAKAIAKEFENNPQDKKTAHQYFLMSIEHYKKSGDKSQLANALWSNAYDLDLYQKNFKESLDNYKKSIALFTELKDTSSLQSVFANVAIIYREHEDSLNAYKYSKQSLDLLQNSSNIESITYCLSVSAENYGHFKNYGKQKEMLLKEQLLLEKTGDPIKNGDGLKAIAKVYEGGDKNYAEADSYYVKAIEEYKKTSDLNKLANGYWSYGFNKMSNLKDYPESIRIFETAYSLFMQSKDSSNASVMRSNVAQTYWSMEDFQKAIDNHKLAIELATKAKNQEMIFKSWNALADLYKKTENPVSSTEALRNAIVALEVLKDTAQLATAYSSIAASYGKSKDYVRSFDYYGKAVAIRKALKDSASWATALYDWAVVYSAKGDYKSSEEKYKGALELHRKTKDKANEVYDLICLGAIEHGSNNNYQKAEAYYNQAMSMAKTLNDENVIVFCYAQMTLLYQSTGRTALAEENSVKALEMYRKLKNWKGVANALAGMAHSSYYVKGDLPKAMGLYDQAQAIADTLSDRSVLADIIEGRATIYEEMGEFAKALELIDKSYALFVSVQNEWGIAGTYIDRGNVYKSITEYETSMKCQFKADSMYLKLGTEYARLAPLANIGGTYMSQGNYKEGLVYSMKAYEIMKKAGDINTNMSIIKGSVGEAYYYLNDFPESEKWLKDALETAKIVGAKRSSVGIYAQLGRLKIDEKKYAEADAVLKEGLRLGKETGNIESYLENLVLSGKLQQEQKQYDKAKVYLDEAIKTCRTIGKDNTLWEALYLQGLVEKGKGDLKQSKELLKESVSVIEKVRNKVTGGEEAQKLFSSDKNVLKAYDALIEVLLALGETEEALTYLQKNNEDNLKAKIRGMDVKFENEEKNNAVLAERTMKAKLDGIEVQIQKEKQLGSEKQSTEKLKNLEGVKTIAESEYLKFVNQQINVQPELSKFFNNSVQPTQFRKIKSKIPKDMALLSYLAGENQLYIFAATSDTVVAKIVSVSREQLIKDINAMLNITRNSMGTFSPMDLKTEMAERKEIVNSMKQTDAMMKPFEDAYHYLIAPVSKEIAGKSRLGIIPTGALNYIPFQMLGKTLENGKFSLMMNQFAIFYANSTDMLFRDASDAVKDYNILAFGNPDKSLPSTEREVNDIKRMYPSASVFLREEATEDRAKYADEKYNVMHFATHGNLDYEDFTKSYLTMAGNPSKSEDGKLTLEELWGMDVMTHLNIVVLSACQTAVTKGSNESSAVSPASGFLQNGVKSVVATLWKVDDEATSLLMMDFYKNLKTMDAVDALRSAQVSLATNKKFSHPYYWAAVVLLGDWR